MDSLSIVFHRPQLLARLRGRPFPSFSIVPSYWQGCVGVLFPYWQGCVGVQQSFPIVPRYWQGCVGVLLEQCLMEGEGEMQALRLVAELVRAWFHVTVWCGCRWSSLADFGASPLLPPQSMIPQPQKPGNHWTGEVMLHMHRRRVGYHAPPLCWVCTDIDLDRRAVENAS